MSSMVYLFSVLFSVWPADSGPPPNIVVITVDTLRADHMSAYGYEYQTTPNIDRLLAKGALFTQARTIEPLTAPSLATMITGLYPHEHGASRNGLPLFPGLISMTGLLRLGGYHTAAFVGNWTLRDQLTHLGGHFDEYHEVFTKKRWFGIFASEATADDLTAKANAWLADYKQPKPFFLWVHYVEPHAPYQFQEPYANQAGIRARSGQPTKSQRYDTEIAFADHSIGTLLERLNAVSPPGRTLVIFTSDHGESLGEHNYWGHGRHLFEPTLHIPLGIVWQGRIQPGTIDAPALIIDLPSTILAFAAKPIPPSFGGFDWSGVLIGREKAPPGRVTFYQAHKGAVQTKKGTEHGRQRGLLEVGLLVDGRKEIYRVNPMNRRVFDLSKDPLEQRNLVPLKSELSKALQAWALAVEAGLNKAIDLERDLDANDLEMLRSLGYIE